MPSVSFTGIDAIHKVTCVKHRGVKPSKATLICRIQGTAPASIGTLTLTDGNASESWQDAAIAWAQRRHVTNTAPHLVSVIVSDRRWKWSQQTISGVYNTRLDDGTVSETNKKSIQELVTVIFQAMGETVDASAAPGDLYPGVNWEGVRCDKALHNLLAKVGCGMLLDYQSNQARVYKRGEGGALPSTGTEIEPPLSLTVGPAPGKLKVAGGAVVVQSKIKLEAVGIDTDGSIKRIDELSYAVDWADQWPMTFPGITGDGNALARQTVWRLWSIKEFDTGGLSIPELENVSITKPTQLLPLRERLLDATKDHNDVQRQNLPFLEGTFYTGSSESRYTGKFNILYDQGLVVTEAPVFSLSAAGIAEPTLYLTIAHHVRDSETDGLVVYDRERSVGSGDNTITDSVPELSRRINRTASTDNKSTLDSEADKYLDAMQVRYAPVDAPSSRRYRGFVFPSLDGAISQVVHRMYGGKMETDASRLYEDDVFSLSERQREADLVLPSTALSLANLLTTSPYASAAQHPVHHGWGRITGTMSPLGSATLRIWVDIGGTETDTGIDITVYDRLLESAGSLTDKWRIRWEYDTIADRYYVVNAACAVDTSATVWGT